MTLPALYRLLAWLSPSYPVGAFSHSHGLEWAVEAGWVTDRDSLVAWLEDLLARGSGWSDAVLFVHAYRAAAAGDRTRLCAVAELAAAAQPSRERRLESTAQGEAFRRISAASWPAPALALLESVEEGGLAYPVAVATLAAGHAVPLADSLAACLHGFCANLVSAAQRLVPLGQTDAQQALALLLPAVEALVGRALALEEGDPFLALGGGAFLSDLCSMHHETQYTRLFRT